jgi:hypothetical protein
MFVDGKTGDCRKRRRGRVPSPDGLSGVDHRNDTSMALQAITRALNLEGTESIPDQKPYWK